MSINGLFSILFDMLAGSPHYMITGSLSFLPLVQEYREPGGDLDVFIRRDVFQARRRAFESAGRLRVLRTPEVAVAGTAWISRVFVPRTGFVHMETGEGLLDIALYEEEAASMKLILGLGFRFSMTRAYCTRLNHLHWGRHEYNAAAPEFMFLTKAVGYSTALRHGAVKEYENTKHYADLIHMARVVDWKFALQLLQSFRVTWRQRSLPELLQHGVNPYTIVDLESLRRRL